MEEIIEEKGFLLQVDTEAAENSRLPWNMLEHNQISDLLPFQYYYKDDKVCFRYGTEGLQPIEEYFQKKKGCFDTLFFLCSGIIQIVEKGEEYLLKPEEYLLKPERIYWNRLEKKISLCYLPGNAGNIKKGYTTLVEYLLEHTEHKDQQAVSFIYGLYDLLISDSFSVEGLKIYFSGHKKSCQKEEEKVSSEKNIARAKYYLEYSGELWRNSPFWEQNIGKFQLPEQKEVMVGRCNDSDIVLPFAEISRNQAMLIFKDNQLFLMDRNSTNGTFLNEKPLSGKEKRPCQKGDKIRFANYTFNLIYQE